MNFYLIHRNCVLTVYPRSPGSERVQQREEMTEEEMIAERKKKMKEIRKVMKEEEKLRQRDREAAATASCPLPQPVVPPAMKEETHSPELSPPPQKRLERPEQCRAYPTSVICRPRSSRDEERPEPQEAASPRAANPPPQGLHGLPLNVERMGHGIPSEQFSILNPYQQNPKNFRYPSLAPRHAQDLSHLPSACHHHPALQNLPHHQNFSSQPMAGSRLQQQQQQQQAPHHHYPPQLRDGYHPGPARELPTHPSLQRAMYPPHPMQLPAPHSIPPPQTLPLSLAMLPLDPINTSRTQPLNELSSQGMKRSTVICQGGGR